MCVKVQFFTLKCESKLTADLVDYNDIAVLLTFQDRLLLILSKMLNHKVRYE